MNCHICDSINSKFLVKLKPIKGHPDLSYYFCLDCGCVYQKEPPSDEVLNQYYRRKSSSSDCFERILKFSATKVPINTWRADWILKNIGGRLPVRRMVDLGCGEGSLVKIFSDMGWDASGIEPSTAMVNFARRHHGIKVTQEPYKEGSFEKGSIGVFTMNQVLEHLKHPEETLRVIRKDLTPDGYLYIDVPTYLLHKKNEIAPLVLASTHLRLYTLDNLAAYLQKNGFDIVNRIPRMEFIDGHPWVGILAKPGSYKKVNCVNNVTSLQVKRAMINARINYVIRKVLLPFKESTKFLLGLFLPQSAYNKIKYTYKKAAKKDTVNL